MPSFSVDSSKCTGCGTCVFVCPKHLLQLEDRLPQMPDANQAKCTSCGQCVAYCPQGAAMQTLSEGRPVERALNFSVANKPIIDGLLKSRRSYRNFAQRPVSKYLIDEILEVANYAPSGRNVRFLRWIVLDTPRKVKDFLQEALKYIQTEGKDDPVFAKRYPPAALIEKLSAGKDPFFHGAPAVCFTVGPKDQRWGEVDCAIATTYFNLAAEARDIGCTYAGAGTNLLLAGKPLRDYLGIRDNETVYMGLFFGYKTVHAHNVPGRGQVPVTYL